MPSSSGSSPIQPRPHAFHSWKIGETHSDVVARLKKLPKTTIEKIKYAFKHQVWPGDSYIRKTLNIHAEYWKQHLDSGLKNPSESPLLGSVAEMKMICKELKQSKETKSLFDDLTSLEKKAGLKGKELTTRGDDYTSGKKVEKDPLIGSLNYQKAAEIGDPEGLNKLGDYYLDIDPGMAREHYEKSANLGNINGMAKLGDCYDKLFQELPITEFAEKSFAWYSKAAGLGNSYAMQKCADCYFQGKGVEKDINKAIEWYKKAVDNGDISAKEKLDKINKLQTLQKIHIPEVILPPDESTPHLKEEVSISENAAQSKAEVDLEPPLPPPPTPPPEQEQIQEEQLQEQGTIPTPKEPTTAQPEKMEMPSIAKTTEEPPLGSATVVGPPSHKTLIELEAKKIASTFEECTDLLANAKGEPSFELIEELKQTTKQAKKLLKDKFISSADQEKLGSIVQQYYQIVKSVEVLGFLRDISRELRNPQMKRDYWDGKDYPDRPLTKRFDDLIADDLSIKDLAKLYKDDKKQWKIKWTAIRERMWKASLSARSFLVQNKKITFISGSKSSTLPSILKVHKIAPKLSSKPALVPTGQLLKHNIVPLAGELFKGVGFVGINQKALSGTSFSGLSTCLSYARNKGFQFNANEEVQFIKNMTLAWNDEYLAPWISRLRVAVLRLLTMGAKTEEYEALKQHIQQLAKTEPEGLPLPSNWKAHAGLIGITHEPLLTNSSLVNSSKEYQRGQVVAVPRSNSEYPKYGIITEKSKNGSYKVIVEKDGFASKNVNPAQITSISESELDRLSEAAKAPLSDETITSLEAVLRNTRENLNDILSLFETVKPFEFSKEEQQLIHEPFPLVWASVTRGNELLGQHFILQHEQAIKGKASLGDDIQLVFTDERNIPTLEELVKPHGVQVMSFEAASYIFGREKNYSDPYSDPDE